MTSVGDTLPSPTAGSRATSDTNDAEERTAQRVGSAATCLSSMSNTSSACNTPSNALSPMSPGRPLGLPPRVPSLSAGLAGFGSPRASMPGAYATPPYSATHSRRASVGIEEDGTGLDYPITAEELAALRAKRTLRNPSYAHIFPQDQWPGYRPIEEHGLIGNMHTCAVVSTDAEISWFCYPHFDSPSIFASILDTEKGGRFAIRAAVEHGGSMPNVTHRQLYHSETNVLISRFLTDSGVGQVIDYMPVGSACRVGHGWLMRELECVRGKMYFSVTCEPAFNYGRDSHEVQIVTHGARFKSDKLSMVLTSSKRRTWTITPRNGVQTHLKLVEGQKAVFIFRESKSPSAYPNEDPTIHDITGHPASEELTDQLKTSTIDFWRAWISKCTYTGRWREAVYRSALVLKLLTFEPTGAIVAAPTTSLPEGIGGTRNWDYRFSWIRDSSFVLYAFIKLGFREEAAAFMGWIAKRCFGAGTQVMLFSGETKSVEAIEVGDELMGDDNTVRRVVSVSRGHTGVDALFNPDAAIYKVIPWKIDQDAFTCNEQHVLVLRFDTRPKVEQCTATNMFRVRWLTVEEPHDDPRQTRVAFQHASLHTEKDAHEFVRRLNWKSLSVEIAVHQFLTLPADVQSEARMYKPSFPLEFAPQPATDCLAHHLTRIFGHTSNEFVECTAWMVGVWLAGPGSGLDHTGAKVELHQAPVIDQVDAWHRMAYGRDLNKKDAFESKFDLGSGARDLLCELGVAKVKQVPKMIARGATNLRVALLTGLVVGSNENAAIDMKEGVCSFASSHGALVDGVIRLAHGLAMSTGAKVPTTINSARKESGWSVQIRSVDASQSQDAIGSKRRSVAVDDEKECVEDDPLSTGFTLAKQAHAPYFGFEVAGTNHRLLLADSTIQHNCEESSKGDGSLQIMYGLHGEHKLEELELDHLAGYMDSKPDIYGELLDTVYLSNKYAEPISYEFWLHVRKMVDWICVHWQERDEGIWEVRGGQQHFVYSKVMSWVALDRGIRLAERRSFPADLARWYEVRNTIYEEIQEKGFSKKRNAFVQHYGSETLDASVLIMPLVFFVSPTDPRFVSTLDAILASTADDGLVSNNLVFRYNVEHTQDGLVGEEGTFSICTFWAVEAAARLGMYKKKYLERARMMFEQMLGYSNACCAGDTAITLDDGFSRPIRTVDAGTHVLSHDKVATAGRTEVGFVAKHTSALLDQGVKECVELLFSDGRTITCTPDHRFLTADGTWITAEAMTVGITDITAGMEYPHLAPPVDADAKWELDLTASLGFKLNARDRLGHSLAFAGLLGHLLTDGRTTEDRSVLFPCHPLDVKAIVRDIHLLTGIAPTDSRDGTVWTIHFPAQLHQAMVGVGASASDRIETLSHLPAFLMSPTCPVSVVQAFIGGLFGGDGKAPSLKWTRELVTGITEIRFSLTRKGSVQAEQTRVTTEELQCLMLRCGIRKEALVESLSSRATPGVDPKESDSIAWSISASATLSFARSVGFRYCCQKQLRLTAACAYYRLRETLSRQKKFICDAILAKEDASADCTLAHSELMACIKEAKEQLAEQENVHPDIMAWEPTEGEPSYALQDADQMGMAIHAALHSFDALKFFNPPVTDKVVHEVDSEVVLPSFRVLLIGKRDAGSKATFDLSVPGTENFIANGLTSHNCGLYSEEIGKRGEHLGNFPQAFTHLALISAALNLDKALTFHRGGGKFIATTKGDMSDTQSKSYVTVGAGSGLTSGVGANVTTQPNGNGNDDASSSRSTSHYSPHAGYTPIGDGPSLGRSTPARSPATQRRPIHVNAQEDTNPTTPTY